jgi:hypothetical protein
LDIVTKYTKSWILLNKYDENILEFPKGKKAEFILDYDESKKKYREFKNIFNNKKRSD